MAVEGNSSAAMAAAPVTGRAPGFWRRQVAGPSTRAQVVFDLNFGVLLPFICLLLDPLVFRLSNELIDVPIDLPVFQGNQPFAWGFMAIEAAALLAWLGLARFRRWRGLFAGLLLPGSLVSAVIGLALLPFSLIGLFACMIGLLGLMPFASGFVFLRNGIRALASMRDPARRLFTILTLILGCVLSLGPPLALEAAIHRKNAEAVKVLIGTGPNGSEEAIGTLCRLGWGAAPKEIEAIATAYWGIDPATGHENAARREHLHRAYELMTGRKIPEGRD